MSHWYEEVFERKIRLGLKVSKTLFSGQSDFQKVEVFETEAYGTTLALDGLLMTSEKDEHHYHEMIVHPAMVTAKNIKRALVIGGGDGGTIREILRYPQIEQVVMIEIDPMVVEVSKKYFPTLGTAWGDPRLDLRFDDGIKYVKESQEEPFDAIFLDGSDPVGPAETLFTQEFYQGCHRLLREGGVFALQSEAPSLFREVFFEIQRKLRSVFKHVHPYFGPVPIYGASQWSWTWASDHDDYLQGDFSRSSSFDSVLKLYNADIHRGIFALPNEMRRDLAKLSR